MITITHTHEQGTQLTGSRKGDGAYDLVTPYGFIYRRSAGIHIPGSRDRDARRDSINAAAQVLRDNGFTVDVTINDQWRPAAVRESARTSRADDRADRLEHAATSAARSSDAHQAAADRVFYAIPGGQPLLPGHHSYRGDRARRDKALASQDRAFDTGKQAKALAARAAAVRDHENAKDNPRAIIRKIERLQADQRRSERDLADAQQAGSAESYLATRGSNIDRLVDDIAHQQATLAARAESGQFVPWGVDNLARGDVVRVRSYGWFKVTRVNRRSVSLDHPDYPRLARFDEIFGRRRAGWQLDSPNGQPLPVKTVVAVARWHRMVRHATVSGADEWDARYVAWAPRLTHGLDLDAVDAQVQAFWPAGDDPETVAEGRRLAMAYLAVFDRLKSGESVGHITGSLPVDAAQPLWRMPCGEPQDVRADRVAPGDLVKGLWDRGYRGRELWPHFCGQVAAVSEVARRADSRDWVSVTLADGTSRDFTTSQWLAVYRCPPS